MKKSIYNCIKNLKIRLFNKKKKNYITSEYDIIFNYYLCNI